MGDFVLKKWNGKKIHIREDRYVNATDMAKATGKNLENFYQTQETLEYLQVLSKRCNLNICNNTKIPVISRNITLEFVIDDNKKGLIETFKGRNGGTYFHPKLALRFAQWCSAEFAVEVDFWLDDMLTGKAKKTLPVGIDPSRHVLYRPLEHGKLAWIKTFPDYFYEALFRLDNRKVDLKAKPPCMAKYTIKYVYDQLERTAPKAIYRELVLLRSEHEKQGLKGLGFLHQYLSDEGRKLLDRTLDHVTFLINLAVEYSPIVEQRKLKLEEWLKQRSGEYVLPFLENPFVYSAINKMRETA